jgi:hypothetical protein
MKRAKKQPRRAVTLAICRGRVIRSAETFAECLGVPVGEVLRIAGVKYGAS